MESYLGKLHLALGSYEALDKYIMKGDLHEALAIIGLVGVDAAKEALKSSKLAKNPREQILLAVGHLQLAQAAYKRQWTIHPIIARGNIIPFAKSTKSYIYTTFLISTCYAWCGEGFLARAELTKADECKTYYFSVTGFANDDNLTIRNIGQLVNLIVGLYNPRNWFSAFSFLDNDIMPWTEYSSLRERATTASYFSEIRP
jgi:hypothetical protein